MRRSRNDTGSKGVPEEPIPRLLFRGYVELTTARLHKVMVNTGILEVESDLIAGARAKVFFQRYAVYLNEFLLVLTNSEQQKRRGNCLSLAVPGRASRRDLLRRRFRRYPEEGRRLLQSILRPPVLPVWRVSAGRAPRRRPARR